jgi:hypothetical protein
MFRIARFRRMGFRPALYSFTTFRRFCDPFGPSQQITILSGLVSLASFCRILKKPTMPPMGCPLRDSAGLSYLSSADRHNVEMCLFHNTNLTLSLVNKTTSAFYQPAEYSIKFSLTIGTTTTTLESPVVFGTEIMDNSHTNPTSFIYREHLPLYQSSGSTVHSSYSGGTSIPTTGTFYVGQKIYKNDDRHP